MTDWCIIAAVNDENVLTKNLAASPMVIAHPDRLVTLRNQPTASAAYNAGLAQTTARICIFVHQDVYLPTGWDTRLAEQIAQLDALDPTWGTAGPFGISREGTHCGRVWSTGLGREIGTSPTEPIAAQSFDELVLIVNRDAGICFDENLPSFHLYGTDIAQISLDADHGAYVIDAPVVHNSRPVVSLRGGFEEALGYLKRKWRARLPIRTPVTYMTRFGIRHLRQRLRMRDWFGGAKAGVRASDSQQNPAQIAKALGYE